jgi:hypothetical protein
MNPSRLVAGTGSCTKHIGEVAPMTIEVTHRPVIQGIAQSLLNAEQSLNDIAQACAVSRRLHVVAIRLASPVYSARP